QPPPTVVAPPTGSRFNSGITVLAATYGANLGLPRGNVTRALADACNNRRECEYRVDFHVLGDPAYGRQKNFVAEWQCGNSPEVRRAEAAAEAGFGSTIQLRCGGPYYPPPVVEQPPPPRYIPPPVVAPATIQVVSGSYGLSCGVPRGNVTGALQQGCNGKSRCDYRVDFHVLGDPAYGCQKDYVAEWRCSNSPQLYRAAAEREAGFGKIVTLACDGSAQPAPPPGPPTGASGIRVRWATYGANCNPALRGNATAALQQACDGRGQCEYRVDFHVLGDPANGCAKEFRTEWTCDNSPGERRAAAPAEAGFGSVVSLRCP
ncbi:MAG TPA: hypothetical protein VFF06_26665, partial [Polyangia bacterium]|nr:hypothetical protein [Polyangia bacterium]